MAKLSDLIKEIFPRKKVVVKQNNKNGNASLDNNEIANNINKNYIFNVVDVKQLEESYESVINDNSSINLKEEIIPIEALISQGKFLLAIEKYEALIKSYKFNNYSRDEMFLIYNGLLNCYINADSSCAVIDLWSQKIEALGTEIEEINRYYFLLGVREYNKQDFEKALIYSNKSIKIKSNYMNAITLKILVSLSNGDITYEEAKNQISNLLEQEDLGIKDYAIIHSCFGNVAFNSRDYAAAQEQYIQSDKYSTSLPKKINIAVCEYFLSFKELHFDRRIELDKIDFGRLSKAEEKFREIYSERNKDTIQTIINLGFSCYINILSLMNKHDDILEIYSENIDLIDDSMSGFLQHIAEAQVVNKIFDEEIISKLSEYEQIKFEAFYYEKMEKYDEVIELLTPIFETKYKDDKVLQLSYLVALQAIDNFEKYMYYYQKFSANDDEVMRMNYIQFLDKMDEKETVMAELKNLKIIAKNGFVLCELMQLYIDYELEDELDDFFKKVDSGDYNIIGFQKPRVFFENMLYFLNTKQYKEYFKLYDETDLSFLGERYQVILKINYYIFKNDFDNLASSYYEYFKITNNHNELIKAVQTKLQINQYHDANFYLEQVNPMLLDLPEYYYIFNSIILRDKNKVEEAFEQLEIVLEKIDMDLDSPFHQFYTAFNMNNKRTDIALRYMSEYYKKNPNTDWFKIIQFSEDAPSSEVIKKLEDTIGGRQDISEINRLFSNGFIGVSVYNKLTGTEIEEIILRYQYPFTRIPVSGGNILETKSKIEYIDDKIILDTTSLILLASVDGLSLLNSFDEIIVPFSTMVSLTEKKTGIFNTYVIQVIEFIAISPRIRKLSVDETLKVKNKGSNIFAEDTLDCVALSRSLEIPFLNMEVALLTYFNLDEIIDINTLSFFLKENRTDLRGSISKLLGSMRTIGFNFISFDAEDMFNEYKVKGIEGIDPFLTMARNAEYKTFIQVYVSFLNLVKDNYPEELGECSIKIIRFLDRYIRKTIYYSSEVCRKHPSLTSQMKELISSPSVSKIMIKKALFETLSSNEEYLIAVESVEFKKAISIATAFVSFVFQYISLFNDDTEMKNKHIDLINDTITVNDDTDINYILGYMNIIEQKTKDIQQ